jgi:hypothetical protein
MQCVSRVGEEILTLCRELSLPPDDIAIMRTLVDLLNDDHGYVRIYSDPAGFGYERSTYAPPPIGDLFDRMGGYESMALVREIAGMQLLAAPRAKRKRKRC